MKKNRKELIDMRTLDKLIERAERKGEAVLNGRLVEYYGFGIEPYVGDLEEKYAVVIDGDTVALRHWGTQTLKINTVTKEVLDIYGESVSDRDSVNYMLRRYNMPYHVHYYPSREEFELHNDIEKVLEVM